MLLFISFQITSVSHMIHTDFYSCLVYQTRTVLAIIAVLLAGGGNISKKGTTKVCYRQAINLTSLLSKLVFMTDCICIVFHMFADCRRGFVERLFACSGRTGSGRSEFYWERGVVVCRHERHKHTQASYTCLCAQQYCD